MSVAVSKNGIPDVAVCGGGFAGLTLALALVRCLGPGFGVSVIDRETAPTGGGSDEDPRAVAFSASSRRLLDALGLWSELAVVAEPVRRIEITDSGLDAGLRPVLLAWDNDIAEGGHASSAAHILPLAALSAALDAAVAAEPAIQRVQSAGVIGLESGPFEARIQLADGGVTTARLVVAADGQRSALREAVGIKSIGWPYAQLGIATAVSHERDT